VTQTNKRKRGKEACCEGLSAFLSPKLFKALCDPTRVALLVRVAESCAPCTVSDIAGCCPIDISVVSRHLAQLRDAGILRAERCGKQVFYSARASELVRTLRAIADAIERCCPGPEADERSKRTTGTGRAAAKEGKPR
jgi:ArsR family transcriptional regulator, arsenate/arsenite/antimonite-responsive transcriptional repressor